MSNCITNLFVFVRNLATSLAFQLRTIHRSRHRSSIAANPTLCAGALERLEDRELLTDLSVGPVTFGSSSVGTRLEQLPEPVPAGVNNYTSLRLLGNNLEHMFPIVATPNSEPNNHALRPASKENTNPPQSNTRIRDMEVMFNVGQGHENYVITNYSNRIISQNEPLTLQFFRNGVNVTDSLRIELGTNGANEINGDAVTIPKKSSPDAETVFTISGGYFDRVFYDTQFGQVVGNGGPENFDVFVWMLDDKPPTPTIQKSDTTVPFAPFDVMVNFSEAIDASAFTTADFTVTNGSATLITPVSGNSTAFLATINPTSFGSVFLRINEDAVVASSNQQESNASNLFEVVVRDDIAPTTESFKRHSPLATTTNADSLLFRVKFDEGVNSVDTSDFFVTGTTANVTNVTSIDSQTYDVSVSGGDLASANGIVGLNFSAGLNITDIAGNSLPNTEPPVDETYTIVNTIPVNLSVSQNTATESEATSITVTATADSAVTGEQTVQVSVTGHGITPDDYDLSDMTIAIPDNHTTGSVTFTVKNDTILESAEIATLTISAPSAGLSLGGPTTANVAITDNDTARLLVNNVIGPEGTAFGFRVVLDNDVQGPFNVEVSFPNGSAIGDTDFDNTPVELNFAGVAGEKHDVIVATTDDDIGMEFIEDFTVTLKASNMLIDDSAFGTGFIDDADVPLPDRASGLTAINIDGVRPTLQWDVATNATSYSVYFMNFATGVVANQSYQFDTEFTHDADLPAGSYRFLVKAVNGAGNGGWSEPFDFTLGTPADAPAAPNGLTAINTETLRPKLQWNPAEGATSYTLYFQNQAGEVFTHLQGVTTTEYVHPVDLPEGEYRFLVKATNSGGSSRWSLPYDFTVGTPGAPPEAPVDLTAIDTDTPQPTLQWAASTGASSYSIYFQNLAGGVVSQASNLTTTEFAHATDLPDGNYRFLVKAVNAGGSSGWSTPHDFAVGSPNAAPNAPTGLRAVDIDTPRPTLQWAASSEATSYAIYFHRLGGDVISQASGLTAISFVQMSDLPEGNYRFLVKSVNASGSSDWSAPFDFTLGQAGLSQFSPTDDQQEESIIRLMDGVMEELAITGI